MTTFETARLVLSDGSVFMAKSFGFAGSASGEVVFNTAMTGYPESLTDPSYKGQILVATYPLIGNYGVPPLELKNGIPEYFESEKIQVEGLVISDYSTNFSHWNARKSLGDWLNENRVPAIFDVDTRQLTRKIREQGAMLGKIVVGGKIPADYDPNQHNLVARVSTKELIVYGKGSRKILLIDCGVKNNIIRCLLNRDCTVYRIPFDQDFIPADYDGILISNGPGNPEQCTVTIQHLSKTLQTNIPIMGICLGTQLLALASGGKTFKLKYGHRGHNQPVLMKGTDRCFITSQNHGYAVDINSLSTEWEVFFENANDGTCEGIRHRTKPVFAIQFHPEASSGPVDTEFLFDEFLNMIKK